MKQKPQSSAVDRTLDMCGKVPETPGPTPIFHANGETERVWVRPPRGKIDALKSLHLAELRDVHTLCGLSHVGMDALDGSSLICQECRVIASKRLLRIVR